MAQFHIKNIDSVLNDLTQNSHFSTPQNKRSIPWILRTTLLIILFCLISLLPFVVLIRLSVFLCIEYAFNGWVAIFIGMSATILLLMFYAFLMLHKYTPAKKLMKYSLIILALIVGMYGIYGTLYLSSVHTKNEQVQQSIRSMHPVLRITTATLSLADQDLIVTDISRTAKDYEAMGLRVINHSLHYEQRETGYSHAVDLRTIGRSEWRNKLLEYTLGVMGFTVIRHVGTADHLHVALPLPS